MPEKIFKNDAELIKFCQSQLLEVFKSLQTDWDDDFIIITLLCKRNVRFRAILPKSTIIELDQAQLKVWVEQEVKDLVEKAKKQLSSI